MRTIQHSTCSVIPRHMLQHIAVHGDDDARETVSSTLHHSALIARERATSYLKPSIRKKSGSQKRSVYDAQNLAHASGRLRLDARRRLGEFQGRQGSGHHSHERFAEGRNGAEAPDRLMRQPPTQQDRSPRKRAPVFAGKASIVRERCASMTFRPHRATKTHPTTEAQRPQRFSL